MREASLREVAVERINQNAPVAMSDRSDFLLQGLHRCDQSSGIAAAEKPLVHVLSFCMISGPFEHRLHLGRCQATIAATVFIKPGR